MNITTTEQIEFIFFENAETGQIIVLYEEITDTTAESGRDGGES